MDFEDIKKLLWALAFVVWAAIILVVALAPEPEFDCITDMECEMKYGPM